MVIFVMVGLIAYMFANHCRIRRISHLKNVICAVDVTVYHRGYHGDLNETFLIGNVKDVGQKLVQTTWECLQKAIESGELGSA